MEHVLREIAEETRIVDFSPYGYDERQFCSPGFDLPIGRLTRSPHGEYPEYHTSADDLYFITPTQLDKSLLALRRAVEILETDRRYVNTAPYGEPNLGRRGLYRHVGGAIDKQSVELGYLWMLSQSDGTRSLLEVACASGVAYDALRSASQALLGAGLLEDVGPGAP
jgi:aminopeptidase-like protein